MAKTEVRVFKMERGWFSSSKAGNGRGWWGSERPSWEIYLCFPSANLN